MAGIRSIDFYTRAQSAAQLALKQDLDEKDVNGGYLGIPSDGIIDIPMVQLFGESTDDDFDDLIPLEGQMLWLTDIGWVGIGDGVTVWGTKLVERNDTGSNSIGTRPTGTWDAVNSLTIGANTSQSSGNYNIQSGENNIQTGDYNAQSGFANNQTGTSNIQGGAVNNQSGAANNQSGEDNTQSGDYNIQCGASNTQTGDYSIQNGASNNQSGASSLQSGAGNTQSGDYGLQSGLYADDFGLYGARTHAAGRFAAAGDAQIIELVARKSTTNATPAELFLDGSSARIVLQNNSTYFFRAEISARRTDADGESAAYILEGCIDRNANAASTALVGTVLKTVLAEDNTAWNVEATADTTNGSLKIEVTGEAAKTIYWVAFIRLVKVTG